MANDITRSKKFREFAELVRVECSRRDVTFFAGQVERFLADRIAFLAQQMGITERSVLDQYLTEDHVTEYAKAISRQLNEANAAADEAPPVKLDHRSAARVSAAHGMAVRLAAEHLEDDQADAIGIVNDAADTVVALGSAVARAGESPIEFGGIELTVACKVINQVVDKIQRGQWQCHCPQAHDDQPVCPTAEMMIRDLALLDGPSDY